MQIKNWQFSDRGLSWFRIRIFKDLRSFETARMSEQDKDSPYRSKTDLTGRIAISERRRKGSPKLHMCPFCSRPFKADEIYNHKATCSKRDEKPTLRIPSRPAKTETKASPRRGPVKDHLTKKKKKQKEEKKRKKIINPGPCPFCGQTTKNIDAHVSIQHREKWDEFRTSRVAHPLVRSGTLIRCGCGALLKADRVDRHRRNCKRPD